MAQIEVIRKCKVFFMKLISRAEGGLVPDEVEGTKKQSQLKLMNFPAVSATDVLI